MFSKRTKKIFTALIIVMVAIGLVGQGVLLFIGPGSQVPTEQNQAQIIEQTPGKLPENTEIELEIATSSLNIE